MKAGSRPPTRLRYFREHDRPSVLGMLDVGRATEEDRALFTGDDSAYEELVPVGRLRALVAELKEQPDAAWDAGAQLENLLDELTTKGTGQPTREEQTDG